MEHRRTQTRPFFCSMSLSNTMLTLCVYSCKELILAIKRLKIKSLREKTGFEHTHRMLLHFWHCSYLTKLRLRLLTAEVRSPNCAFDELFWRASLLSQCFLSDMDIPIWSIVMHAHVKTSSFPKSPWWVVDKMMKCHCRRWHLTLFGFILLHSTNGIIHMHKTDMFNALCVFLTLDRWILLLSAQETQLVHRMWCHRDQ